MRNSTRLGFVKLQEFECLPYLFLKWALRLIGSDIRTVLLGGCNFAGAGFVTDLAPIFV